MALSEHKKELIEAGVVVIIAAGLFLLLRHSSSAPEGIIPSSVDTTPVGSGYPGGPASIQYNYPAGNSLGGASAPQPPGSIAFFAPSSSDITGGDINAPSTSQCGCCTAPPIQGNAAPTMDDLIQQINQAAPNRPTITQSNPYSFELTPFGGSPIPGNSSMLSDGSIVNTAGYQSIVNDPDEEFWPELASLEAQGQGFLA